MSDDKLTPNSLNKNEIKKTSAVPLRKETVRVSLKSLGAPQGGSDANAGNNASSSQPLLAPRAMTPGTDRVEVSAGNALGTPGLPRKQQETMRVALKADGGPPAPTSSQPVASVPAPTIPLGQPAPTIPLGQPAPTIPLGRPAPSVPLGAAPTVPLQQNVSQPLPKATVQLQQTQQLTQSLPVAPGAGTPQVATIQTVSEEDLEEKRGVSPLLWLNLGAFVLSLIVMFFCFNQASIWVDKHHNKDVMSILDGLRDE